MSNAIKIPVTAITKYRALMMLAALELGWKFAQEGTNSDVYTKGTDAIHVVWGSTQMVGFTHTRGTKVVTTARGEVSSKLQRCQSALGKPMDVTKKWPKLSPAKVTELEALAVKSFRVIEPKA